MGPLLTAAANAHTSLVVPDTADLQQLKCRPLENYVDYGGYRALLQFPGKHQANHAAMAVEIALALWREALDAAGPQLQRSRTTAEQLLPNVIQRPWLYENDETHLLPLLYALEEERFARQIFQSASVDSLQLDLLRACNHLHCQALGTRLLALLRQNPFPASAWQMPPSRYEQALARGLSGKKPR